MKAIHNRKKMNEYKNQVVTYTKGIENESNSQQKSLQRTFSTVVTYTKGIENESNSQRLPLADSRSFSCYLYQRY